MSARIKASFNEKLSLLSLPVKLSSVYCLPVFSVSLSATSVSVIPFKDNNDFIYSARKRLY